MEVLELHAALYMAMNFQHDFQLDQSCGFVELRLQLYQKIPQLIQL